MTTQLTRRGILKALGIGAAATLIEEPVRKLWFVSSNAPVGSRIERPSSGIFSSTVARAYIDGQKGLEAAIAEEDLFRKDLLNKLWTKARSQKDLDILRAAARIVDTLYHGVEREKLMAEYDAGLIARRRKSGAWRAWDPAEEYEADHQNNNVSTLVLAG